MDPFREFTATQFYSAYGLTIASQLPLPELQPAAPQSDADLVITFGPVAWAPERLPQDGYAVLHHAGATTSYYFWQETGPICIRDGREIRIDAQTTADAPSLRLPILGQLMALVLLQRGHLVLHASAVALDEQGLIFVGDNRSGKSTLAAALHARGYGFLADDVVALNGAQTLEVLPAFPRLKLWPEALSLLRSDPETVPPLVAGYDKRDYRVAQRHCDRAVPLARIYVLCHGREPEIEPLAPIDALRTLLPHSFANRLAWNQDEGRKARDFKQLAGLLKRTPAFLLKRPPGGVSLTTLADLLEEHDRSSRLRPAGEQPLYKDTATPA